MPIRLRLVLFFTAASLISLVFGGWYFVARLEAGLLGSLDTNLSAQWSIAAQGVPSPSGQEGFQDGGGRVVGSIPITNASASGGTEYIVQLLAPSGKVLQSNQAAGPRSLLDAAKLAQASRGPLLTTSATAAADPVRLLAGTPSKSRYIVLVGASLENVDSTLATVRRDLVIAGIAILAASALGSLLLATAALSPVERLRRQVSELSALDEEVVVEVPKTNDEIASLARTMNALLHRLHTALVQQRAFVADAGHELRTPFAILQAELELACRPGRTRAELENALENASEEASRLSRLSEDLLSLARYDETGPDLHVVRARVRPVLVGARDLVRARAERKGVTMSVDAATELEANFDPVRVRQAVDNLVDNALRFAPHGSEIVLKANASDHGTRIAVTDTGPGFPEEFLPHAFERFRRPDDSRSRENGGTGLGLAIVAAIANWHHGRTFAHNLTTGGTEVGFEITGLDLQGKANARA